MGTTNEQLAGAIAQLSEQVLSLRDSIDEFKSAIKWGLQNDKFTASDELCDRVDEVARDAVAEASAGIKDALDQFSIDAQHVARQMIQSKAAQDIAAMREDMESFMGEMRDVVTQIRDAVTEHQGTLFAES